MMYRSKMAKKCFAGVAGMMLVATVLFGGCTDGQAGSAAQEKPAASQEISDARNTPVVRAAKAVGPAVVGITNKAVARDWFNNPV